jgi:hypothetical protein
MTLSHVLSIFSYCWVKPCQSQWKLLIVLNFNLVNSINLSMFSPLHCSPLWVSLCMGVCSRDLYSVPAVCMFNQPQFRGLNYSSFVINLKIWIPSNLFSFFKTIMAILDPWLLHMYFRIILSDYTHTCLADIFWRGEAGLGIWTQGFMFAKQPLYPLSHIPNPFWSGYFWRWYLVNYLSSWPWITIIPISASQVARITGVSHKYPAVSNNAFCLKVYLLTFG